MPGVLYEHVVSKECSFQQGAGIDPLKSFAVIEYKMFYSHQPRGEEQAILTVRSVSGSIH